MRVQSGALSSIARSLAVALGFVILSSPPLVQAWIGGDTRPFIAVTIALAIVLGLLVWSWAARDARRFQGRAAVGAESARAYDLAVYLSLIVVLPEAGCSSPRPARGCSRSSRFPTTRATPTC